MAAHRRRTGSPPSRAWRSSATTQRAGIDFTAARRPRAGLDRRRQPSVARDRGGRPRSWRHARRRIRRMRSARRARRGAEVVLEDGTAVDCGPAGGGGRGGFAGARRAGPRVAGEALPRDGGRGAFPLRTAAGGRGPAMVPGRRHPRVAAAARRPDVHRVVGARRPCRRTRRARSRGLRAPRPRRGRRGAGRPGARFGRRPVPAAARPRAPHRGARRRPHRGCRPWRAPARGPGREPRLPGRAQPCAHAGLALAPRTARRLCACCAATSARGAPTWTPMQFVTDRLEWLFGHRRTGRRRGPERGAESRRRGSLGQAILSRRAQCDNRRGPPARELPGPATAQSRYPRDLP